MNTQAIAVQDKYGRAIMSGFHGLFSMGGLAGVAAAALAMSTGIGPPSHLLARIAVLLLPTLGTIALLLPTASPTARRDFRRPRGPLIARGMLVLCRLMAEGAIGDCAAVAEGQFSSQRRVCGPRLRVILVCHGRGPFAWRSCGAALWRSGRSGCGVRGRRPRARRRVLARQPDRSDNRLCRGGARKRCADFVPHSRKDSKLAIAAVSTAGYCGFLLGPPVIGVIADHFMLGAGLAVVAFDLAIIALGGASLASEGGRRRWMALSTVW